MAKSGKTGGVSGGARQSSTPTPRVRTAYRMKQHGRPSSNVSDDNLTIRLDGPAVDVLKPSFTGGPTVFRPFPALNADDPSKVDPIRYSSEELDFTDWIRSYEVAAYVGTTSPKTFILYDKVDQNYNRSTNPYIVFANNVINGVKKSGAGNGRWNPLVPGMSSKPAIKWPTKMYMMQGLCFAHGDKIYVNEGPPRGASADDKPVLLQATKSVGDTLMTKLEMQNPKFKGQEDDYDNMFLHGDVVGFNHGRFLTIYNPEKGAGDTAAAPAAAQKVNWKAGARRNDGGGGGGGGGGSQMSSYAVKITRQYRTARGVFEADLSDQAAELQRKLVWWDDVIRIPTEDELCLFIAQAFADHPQMLEYAWADYPHFFTSDVQKVLRQRVTGPSASVPTAEDEEEEAGTAPVRRRNSSATLPREAAADDEEAVVENVRRQPEKEEDEEEKFEDEGLDEDTDIEEDEDDDVDTDTDNDDDEDDDEEDADDEDGDSDDEDSDDDDEDEDGEEADDDLDDEEEDDDEEDGDDDEAEVLDDEEAALESAVRAAEERSSRRNGGSGKTTDSKPGKAPAQVKGAASSTAHADAKENEMAAKKGASKKPAQKASAKPAPKSRKSK